MTAAWAPPADAVRAVTIGHAWDAVRVPDEPGVRALKVLGGDSGAVIGDGFARCLYWLIPPGTAADWHLPAVQVLSEGPPGVLRYIEVPPAGLVTGPGPHWLVPYRPDAYLTDAGELHAALRSVTAELTRADPAQQAGAR